MSELDHAVIVWVQRCLAGRLSRPCSSLADLCDGVLLSQVLHDIAPSCFEVASSSDDEQANWALRLSTLKRVVRSLSEYYATHLGKDVRHIEGINITAIARELDTDELLSLVELVVGAAVMCDDKARFIQDIFSLDAASQLALKGLIEQCMAHAQPQHLQEQEQELPESSSSTTGEAQAMIGELQQVVGHLYQERQRLLEEASANAQAMAALQRDNAALSLRVAELERDQEASEGSDRHRSSVAAGLTEILRRELDECKRELDVRMVEADNLRAGARNFEQRLAASKELQARLEMENAQIGDELDVLRDKAARLGRAEQAADKYAKKLEELPAMRKENKDLLARLDQYLDKIQELEAGSRAGATLQRLVDQYKDKAIEMERDKFEALSARQMQQHELTRLQQEAEDAQEARRFLEDELAATRAELEQYQGDGGGGKTRSSTSSFHGEGDLFDTETMASLREKLRIAERELRTLHNVGSGSGSGSSNSSAEVVPSPSAAQLSYEELLQRDAGVAVQELALCRAELEDALRAKHEREEALISLRKQLSEAQLEMQRAHKLLAEGDSGRGGGTAAAESSKGDKGEKGNKALKESEAKLAQAQNTLRLLEERLREQETSLSGLEQQKDALEVFSRSSLQAFKDKFTHSLELWKEERAVLQAKLASAQQRTDQQQATTTAEQRLVTSAIYELGAKIMDRNLQGLPLGGGGGGAMMDVRKRSVQGTFLGMQTAAQLRVLDSQLLAAGAGSLTGTPSTPFR